MPTFLGVSAATWATAGTVAAVAGGVAAVGSAAYALSQPTPKPPSVPAPPPAATPASVASAAAGPAAGGNRGSAASASGMGFNGTINTSPLGTGSVPQTAKASLGAGISGGTEVSNPLGGSKNSTLGGS